MRQWSRLDQRRALADESGQSISTTVRFLIARAYAETNAGNERNVVGKSSCPRALLKCIIALLVMIAECEEESLMGFAIKSPIPSRVFIFGINALITIFFLQASARADDLVLMCNGSTMELNIDHRSARWTSNDAIYGNLDGILNVSANSYEMLFERHFAAAATILWKFSLDRRTGIGSEEIRTPFGTTAIAVTCEKLASVKF